MRNDLTEMVFVLDRSGSMEGLEADTVGGFNSMLARQREEEGGALVSCVLFNHVSSVVLDRVPLAGAPDLTAREYRVGGSTALIDALGDAMHHIALVHRVIREEDRPAHTVFVITTDGMENASTRYTADAVRAEVSRHREQDGWEFLFLGANIDAVSTAARYGIDSVHTAQFVNDGEGQRMNFACVDEAVTCVRRSKTLGTEWKKGIEEHTRRKGR